MIHLPQLPITDVLPELLANLATSPNAVLVAPPGAGKTTVVPLALLHAPWRDGRKIIVLEPRRIAARSAAHRMAHLLGEKVGDMVGYRVRFDSKISKQTMIEVVTEGVFTRMLASDPGLEDTAAVLFDEFHERSLDGDLALALCLDLQAGLREDLRLLPMSATIDGSGVASMMGAVVVESEGRSFPVTHEYRERRSDERLDNHMTAVLQEEARKPDSGSILAFLPGQGEIERVYDRLLPKLPDTFELHRLYGAVGPKAQDAAISPLKDGKRKIVLASAIAETSLTIEGIETVVDSGLSRQPVYEPATGLTRLETVRSSLASVTQRAGRAGRLSAGRAVRLWREEQTKALPKHTPPEIVNADLASLLLDLSEWGVSDPAQLKWMDEPPKGAVAEAKALLKRLRAFNGKGALTPHGKAMQKLSLPPRFAHMVLRAAEFGKPSARRAALLALLVQERGVGGPGTDLGERCERVERNRNPDGRTKTVLQMAKRIADQCKPSDTPSADTLSPGVLLAFGFDDRVARQQGQAQGQNEQVRFKLANGRGAVMDAREQLSREEFIVALDMSGRAGAARILSAAAITVSDLNEFLESQIEDKVEGRFNAITRRLEATRTRKLGALALGKSQPVKVDPESASEILLSAVRSEGLDILPWRDVDRALQSRLSLLHRFVGEPWPDVSDEVLSLKLEEWLLPFLANTIDLADLGKGALSDGLMLLAKHPSKAQMDQLLPKQFAAPSGSTVPIQYYEDRAVISLRPQELFGLDVHPSVLNNALPVEIELLSPAGRPIQITRDLPGFWRGTWADVRSDMRGRYPKHPWPEDALSAEPTRRVKPRKTPKA